MRTPIWLRSELETLGRQVLGGDISRNDAADLLANAITSRDGDLAHQVLASYGRKEIRDWVKSQLRDYYAADEQAADTGDRQLELFPHLPRLLETSPGRFSHINSMTGPDWDAALRQAEVKADNAGAYAKGIRKAYDEVRHLLDDEGKRTTLAVAPQLAGRLM
jgi:hypothetical protein